MGLFFIYFLKILEAQFCIFFKTGCVTPPNILDEQVQKHH
jgi:hypothetical protein